MLGVDINFLYVDNNSALINFFHIGSGYNWEIKDTKSGGYGHKIVVNIYLTFYILFFMLI